MTGPELDEPTPADLGQYRSGTRAQHVEWCKARALAELEDNRDGRAVARAMQSLASDWSKHPETAKERGAFGFSGVGVELGMMELTAGTMRSVDDARRHIVGMR